ncbi:cyclic nucleotide-binding domain-containing protein [Rhodoblastus sp.]|uniref:cyclic nucleotide-binding domain-containing protein n=1 Tax=Rhodoblastus sp. TaxID=1962975 RepID=UPI003F9DD2F0
MSLGSLIDALKRLPLFADFEVEALRLLAFAAPQVEIPQGEFIFRRGDRLDAGYYILSGTIRLSDDAANGRDKIVGPGALIGSRGLLSDSEAGFSAIAQEKAVALKLSHVLFRRVLTEFPASAAALKQSLVRDVAGLGKDIAKKREKLMAIR